MTTMIFAWGLPLILFVFITIRKIVKENAAARRQESAIDPLFRPKQW